MKRISDIADLVTRFVRDRERRANGRDARHNLTATAVCPYMRPMALRKIIISPEPQAAANRSRSSKVTADIRALVDDMFETMYDAPGHRPCGDPGRRAEAHRHHGPRQEGRAETNPRVFINPEIVWSSDEKRPTRKAACRSRRYYEEVERPARVKVRFLDLDGKQHEDRGRRSLATCIQHEIDHLNGVLFIDHISKLKRDRVIKKFTKAAKRARRSKLSASVAG